MAWWNWVVSPVAAALGWGKDKKKEDPYAALMNQLNPLIKSQQEITTTAGKEGLANIGAARQDYDFVNTHLRKLLEGSDDELLKMLDVQGATKNIDENEQQLAQQGIRGGRNAAMLGQGYFNRDTAIDNLLKQLRFAAPGQMANIAQAIGNLGTGELSASTGASGQASNLAFGIEQVKDADADRRAETIASIFESIGATVGMVACLEVGSLIDTHNGKVPIEELEVGDEVISRTDAGTRVWRKVIRVRRAADKLVRVYEGKRPNATASHVFYDNNFNEVLADTLEFEKVRTSDVVIIKLQDEKANYPFRSNGFWSADDDIETGVN
jgi:Hint domain